MSRREAVDGTDELARSFGQTLHSLRRRAGFSQDELGVLASLHRTEIGLLEHGRRLPRLDTIIKLASVLAVPPGELLVGMGWATGSNRKGSFLVSGLRPPAKAGGTISQGGARRGPTDRRAPSRKRQ